MNKTYVIANHKNKKEKNIIEGLKNSFLLSDIGIKNDNFIVTIILATIIAIGSIYIMYYLWRI